MSLLAKYNKSRVNVLGGFNLVGSAAQHAPSAVSSTKLQRLKTWELPSMFHCSIVGTCLTTTELRQVLGKIGNIDTRTATDHTLHTLGVQAAGQRGIGGKLLNKALDRRHETIIKRFSRLTSAEDARELWDQCVDQGDISGAYWAVMSHPVMEKELVRRVFGEVHMLSHLVGSSSRLDIARLKRLQEESEAKDEKIARQEWRLREIALQNETLHRRIDALEVRAARDKGVAGTVQHADDPADIARVLQKSDAAQAHADELTLRLRTAELKLKAAEKRASVETARSDALRRELTSVEALLLSGSPDAVSAEVADAPRASMLYVGGRRNLFEHLRAVAERKQIELLFHDGGLEDSLSLLPGLIGQTTATVFPVDCVSHSAAGLVKRLCRESGKAYLPIRSASVASFAAALSQGARIAADDGRLHPGVSPGSV